MLEHKFVSGKDLLWAMALVHALVLFPRLEVP